jgi:TonB family protein
MRKTAFVNKSFCRAIVYCLILLATVSVLTVALMASSPAVPTDPKALLVVAAQTNGLAGETTHPWHLIANITKFDEKGVEHSHGIYEEFWAGPQDYKVIYTAGTFSQTAIHTKNEFYLSGSQGTPPAFLIDGSTELLEPIPNPHLLNDLSVKSSSRKAGNTSLDCLNLEFHHLSLGTFTGPTYCLRSDSAILRGVTNIDGNALTIYNQITKFGDAYIAHDIVISWRGAKILEVEVTCIEGITPSAAANGTRPDVSSITASENTSYHLSTGVNGIITMVSPSFSINAATFHETGSVDVRAHIDTSGNVTSVQADSGPQFLQNAALQAVKQWKFRPFILYGKRVEGEAVVRVSRSSY